jgi:transporter family-2 protein
MLNYVILTAVAGVLIPVQALLNARLGSYLSGPLSAAFVNFAVGLSVLAGYLLILRTTVPSAAQMAAAPAWAWLGGVLGAFFVTVSTLSVIKLGAAGMISIIIAGQLIASILLDHYGVLHAAQPITAMRVLGAVLLLAGAYLILRPGQ